MCGIIGISKGQEKTLIEKGLSVLEHRGPDDRGIFADDSVSFGHCRLSIIDLSSAGHQPMGESIVITFNGEIYNYKQLKEELEKSGSKFRSNSDTEVIIKGYEKEGTAFFSRLRGMWAFGIYDNSKDEIILSRDNFGIKPLYYSVQDNKLFFASEVKALRKILKKVSPNADFYYQFWNLGYFPGGETCFKEIKKVLPGEIIVWKNNSSSLSKNFIPLKSEKEQNLTFDQSVELVKNSLKDSVKAHYVADVEVGLLLSGGTDSSLIAAISKEIRESPVCYHVAIKNSIDTEYARKIAKHLGLKLVERELSSESLETEYRNLENWIDVPTSDLSIIPTALVFKSINKQSKVVLSGEGGDELFGGYLRHKDFAFASDLEAKSSILSGLYNSNRFGIETLNPLIRRIEKSLESKNIISSYLHNVKTLGFPFNEGKIKSDLEKIYKNHPYKELIPKNMFYDMFLYLPDSLLYKNDTSSMISSIEARVPLVDRVFVESIAKIPAKYRLSGEYQGKAVLKEVLSKMLPKELVERPKKGFGFSFDAYGSDFFIEDYKKAAKFHIQNSTSFGIDNSLKKIFSEKNSEIICKKFPRFAFSVVTNWLVFKD